MLCNQDNLHMKMSSIILKSLWINSCFSFVISCLLDDFYLLLSDTFFCACCKCIKMWWYWNNIILIVSFLKSLDENSFITSCFHFLIPHHFIPFLLNRETPSTHIFFILFFLDSTNKRSFYFIFMAGLFANIANMII